MQGPFFTVWGCLINLLNYLLTMPYEWSTNTSKADNWELVLWPYKSLLRKDFVFFFGATTLLTALPLIALIGKTALWGILPFIGVMMFGLWTAINTSYKRGRVLEVFAASADMVTLTRHNPDGSVQSWSANKYWASVHLHPTEGPVENYLPLRGGDREVEIGAFLDVAERMVLYGELRGALGPSKMG